MPQRMFYLLEKIRFAEAKIFLEIAFYFSVYVHACVLFGTSQIKLKGIRGLEVAVDQKDLEAHRRRDLQRYLFINEKMDLFVPSIGVLFYFALCFPPTCDMIINELFYTLKFGLKVNRFYLNSTIWSCKLELMLFIRMEKKVKEVAHGSEELIFHLLYFVEH